MRGRRLRRRLRSHGSKPLVVRGGLARTFGGLATFLAVLFLTVGVYILNDALSNPVEAQAAAMITGAISVALSIILFFYLLKPGSRPRSVTTHHRHSALSSEERAEFGRSSWTASENDSRKDLAYQRIYVDHSLIAPREQMGHHAREVAGK